MLALVLAATGARAEGEVRRTSPEPVAPGAGLVAIAPPPAGPGVAETEDELVVAAREAFLLGSALAREEQWAEAAGAFERSARLKPHPVTLYDVAYCHRALGHLTRAREAFLAALEPAPSGERLEADLGVQAQAYVADLEQRIVRVTLALGEPGLSVLVDQRPVVEGHPAGAARVYVPLEQPVAVIATHPPELEVWLDPGPHRIAALRDGLERAAERIEAAPGVRLALRLPPASLRLPQQELDSQGRDVGPAPSPDRTWALVALGVGVAGFVTSGVATALALDARSACPGDVCATRRDRDAVLRHADAATVGAVVGGVATAAGVALWVFPPSSGRASASPRVRAWVGAGRAGLRGTF